MIYYTWIRKTRDVYTNVSIYVPGKTIKYFCIKILLLISDALSSIKSKILNVIETR